MRALSLAAGWYRDVSRVTCRMEDGRLVYVREAKQEQLLLMHLLVVALDLEGWRMAPQQFELLRRELKATPTDIVTRWAHMS